MCFVYTCRYAGEVRDADDDDNNDEDNDNMRP